MKINFLSSAFFACALVFLAGCSEDEIIDSPKPTPELGYNEGDIVIGARTGFENGGSTRTIYTGNFYTDNGVKYEQVDWLKDDRIAVFSPQAFVNGGTGHMAEYYVTNLGSHDQITAGTQTQEGGHYATFAPYAKTGTPPRLQWNGEGEHDFYAFYSAPSYNPSVTMKQVSDGVEITGNISVAQNPIRIDKDTISKKEGAYIARPVMANSYMTAITSARQSDGSVNLTFKSIVTAIEVELVGVEEEIELLSVMLSDVNKKNLTGPFTVKLTKETVGYPAVTDNSEEIRSQVTIPLSITENGVTRGWKISQAGEHKRLKVVFFLHPAADLSNLQITIQGVKQDGTTGIKTHPLNRGGQSESVRFEAHKKHYINNVKIPSKLDASQWMGLVHDDALLSQLSIPGTYGSYTSYTQDPNYKAQTIRVSEQWAMGIRCFEVTTDEDATKILAGVNKDTGNTIDQALEAINRQLTDHSTEAAIVLVRYQPVAGRGPNGQTGLTGQKTFITKMLSKINQIPNATLYDPAKSMGDVRGQFMFILSPSSDGEDMLADVSDLDVSKVVLVEGCGSLHDKWKQRGYPTLDTDPSDPSKHGNCGFYDPNGSMEQYMFGTSTEIDVSNEQPDPNAPKTFPSFPQKGPLKYDYRTNSGQKVWINEWNRVAENEIIKPLKVFSSTRRNRGQIYHTHKVLYVKWKESYSEKLADAKATFDKAIEVGKGANDVIFINSLAGYFIKPDEPLSEDGALPKSYYPLYNGNGPEGNTWDPDLGTYTSWGGSYGDYAGLANKINPEMYTYITSKWDKHNSGPMGILLMSRLKEPKTGGGFVDGSVQIPQIVVSNNFTFPMKRKGGQTPNVKSGNSYANGGNVLE